MGGTARGWVGGRARVACDGGFMYRTAQRARGREGTSGDAQTGDGWMDGWRWMGVTLGPAGARARTKREEEDCFVLTF